ncbi:hypothetical protein [Emticicia sp. C21]|uniref:hypothetical protein n=1 Tax=Emticicia sp. C21 TaxID=2302915 RepID=UPI000E3539F2|nr:hypothetical protein [Emticicia sp. C21]RFS17214.1 hypothetical protein D0T08_05385 [Emticicia sp. C21]
MEEKFSEIHHQIVDELGTAFSKLGADIGLMAIVMSWGDTLESKIVLQQLQHYNNARQYQTTTSEETIQL